MDEGVCESCGSETVRVKMAGYWTNELEIRGGN